jgi:hypothetical protein
MASGKIELFDDHHVTGFDGMYERDTYYRLIGNEDATVTLEIETNKSTTGHPEAERTYERYQIKARDLAKLIQANGARLA